MTGAQLRRLAADPAAFRAALMIDTDAGPRRRLADCLDPWQAADFAAIDPAWLALAGGLNTNSRRRAWLERPRGHSKTSDLAVMVTWGLFASRRRLSGVAAAADRDQARLLRNAIDKHVRANPWLADLIDVQAYRVVNRVTGSELEILSADAPSSYGLTPDFVIFDELAHWGGKRDLWDSLISAAAKVRRCLVIVITNAGWGGTWQWETREAIRADPAWYFSRLDGPVASWLDPAALAEQRRLLPSIVYERLWLNRWTTGSGDALREDEIQAALTRPGPIVRPERGWIYCAGIDLGLRRDSSALAIVGLHVGYREPADEVDSEPTHHTGAIAAAIDLGLVAGPTHKPIPWRVIAGTRRLCLADLRVWRPDGGTVSIEAVEAAVVAAHERLRLTSVACDPWQARSTTERLRKRGIRTIIVDQTGPNLKAMASETLEAFRERRLDLWPHERLLSDLRSLRVEERGYGFRLVSPRDSNGHGDTATALSIALLAAKRSAATAARLERPLLCHVVN